MSLRLRWDLLRTAVVCSAILGLILAAHSTKTDAQLRRRGNSDGSPVAPAAPPNMRIAPPNDIGVQFKSSQVKAQDIETDTVVRVLSGRNKYGLDGAGLTVAVMDTGLRTTHVDFAGAGKVPAVRNFSTDDGGNPSVVTDLNGHGTNVAGIIVGNGIHTGIAPSAKVVPLKVLGNTGGGSFTWLESALDWVIANRTTHNISVVNMSLGDGGNYTTEIFAPFRIQQQIQQLRNLRVPVIIAAGNFFFEWGSTQGMSYPAINRECISVGAVFDGDIGAQFYGGPTAFTTGPRRLTPFSQRLSSTVAPQTRTDIFAPGAILTAAGNTNDTSESAYQGTSQATPVVAGVCLLLQQFALKKTGSLPTVAQLEKWLTTTSTPTGNLVRDGDDEDDNVTNTNATFPMVDVLEALNAANKDLLPPAPPPAAVTATYSALPTPTLTVMGDANGANLTISAQGKKVTLSGSSTTINGRSTVSFNIPSTFTLTGDLAAGNDNVSLISLKLTNLSLNLGDGNDRVVMNYCAVATSAVDGGAGTDSVISTTSTISVNNNISIP